MRTTTPKKMLPIPSRKKILAAAEEFGKDKYWGVRQAVLQRSFKSIPNNDNAIDVLTKVALLNSLFNTKIYAIQDLADHIVAQSIDSKFVIGCFAVVEDIAGFKVGDTERRCYSFATKYCALHQPDIYPMFDSMVRRALVAYRQESGFSEFTADRLRTYSRFVAVLEEFKAAYGVRNVPWTALDKYLWKIGRHLSTNGA